MRIQIYQKKPESVRAVQLTASTVQEAQTWCGGRQVQEKDPFDESLFRVGLNVPTLDGVVRASEGDYILKNWSGGFQVMNPIQFEELYEPIGIA